MSISLIACPQPTGSFLPVYDHNGKPILDPVNGKPVMMEEGPPYSDGDSFGVNNDGYGAPWSQTLSAFTKTGVSLVIHPMAPPNSPYSLGLVYGGLRMINTGRLYTQVNLEISFSGGAPEVTQARCSVATVCRVKSGGVYAFTTLGDGVIDAPGYNQLYPATISLPAFYRYAILLSLSGGSVDETGPDTTLQIDITYT